MPSMLGIWDMVDRVGCSPPWPARKVVADGVKMRRTRNSEGKRGRPEFKSLMWWPNLRLLRGEGVFHHWHSGTL